MKRMTETRSSPTTDLAADLRTRGCAVCNHVIKTARDFFAQWQYALSSDETSRSRFATELGFCAAHAWQLHSMSSPWGESIGLTPLAERISGVLAEAGPGEATASLVKNLLRTAETCRVCGMLEEVEAEYVQYLGDFLIDPGARRIYERSQGVCLRHLAHLLTVTKTDIERFLLAVAARRFKEIAKQMQNYAAKRDATRRDLIKADEEDAYMRALVHLAGARDYHVP
jgi:hypothetical protein